MPTAEPPAEPDAVPPEPGDVPTGRGWRLAGFLLLLGEALAPLGGAVWSLVLIITGRAVVPRNDLLVGLLLLITGLGLVLVAVRLREGRPGVRIASLLWQVLLVLAVAGPMWQAGRHVLAALLVVWAVAAGIATVQATREPEAPARP
ncbi:hypothetical protein GCM10027446_15480 [Angustibacter peucedani]